MTKRNIGMSILAVLLAALAGAVAAKAYDAHKSAQDVQAVPSAQWVGQNASQNDPWAVMEAQMRQMQAQMDQAFNSAFARDPFAASPMTGQSMPTMQSGISDVKVQQKGKDYVVTAKLPGSNGDNVKVDLNGRLLSISSQSTGSSKQTSGKGKLVSQEQFSSSSQQAFTLPGPVNANGMKTQFKDGVLTVTIPKATS